MAEGQLRGKRAVSTPLFHKVSVQDYLEEDPESTRMVLRYLKWAALWLIIGTGVGLTAAIKLYYPDVLPAEYLSFGRIRQVHTNTVFWGWTSLALVGLCIYVVPRTTRTRLYSFTLARVALWLWNLTVFGGIVTLALGISNGNQEYREYIRPLAVMFATGLVIHVYNFYQTIAHRRTREIYISNWYILGASLWTLVLYTVAYLPWYQKGLSQTIVQGYYMHTGVGMWFTPVVLGLTYYFLPKFLNRPIYSYALGLLGFWTQMVFYSLIGTHHYIYSPIPWWLQTTAIVFSVGMMVPVWSGTGNFLLTMRGMGDTIRRSYSLPFILVGAIGYGLVSTQGTIEAFRITNVYLHFTNFTVGHSHISMYGFVAFLIWGGIYGLVPRITKREPPILLVGVHFWFSLIGVLVFVLSLSIGGIIQGMDWLGMKPFIQSVVDIMPYWLWRTVGGTLMFLGHLVFAYNLYRMLPAREKAVVAEHLEAVAQ
jgi:cytochrome c oxidase cbb3-type subunit 1